jgi:hypothetical protein
MSATKRTIPAGDRIRVTAYLSAEAWEALSTICMNEGRSMSGVAADCLHKFLQRHGVEVEETTPRAVRKDFKPAATLSAALKAREGTLSRQMERLRAKQEKVARRAKTTGR